MKKHLISSILCFSLLACGSEGETTHPDKDSGNKEQNPEELANNNKNSQNSSALPTGVSWEYSQLEEVNVAVFGDSISKGLFAHRTFDQYDMEKPLEKAVLSALTDPSKSNLGSELKDDPQHSKEELTATASTQPWSIPSFLAEEHHITGGNQINIVNHSISGETVSGVLEKFDNTLQHGAVNFDYVLIFLGSNDFCSSSSKEEFQEKYDQLLDKVLSQDVYKNSRIIVLSLPNFKHLNTFESTFDTGLIPISIKSLVRPQICPTLKKDDDELEARQQAFKKGIEDVLLGIKDKAEIHYVSNIDSILFEGHHLSLDGFHPSEQGQKLLSDTVKDSLFNY